jgi:hypothetical protein
VDVKQYLEYLDKEMTIMGILSAVSVAAPAGILNRDFHFACPATKEYIPECPARHLF